MAARYCTLLVQGQIIESIGLIDSEKRLPGMCTVTGMFSMREEVKGGDTAAVVFKRIISPFTTSNINLI